MNKCQCRAFIYSYLIVLLSWTCPSLCSVMKPKYHSVHFTGVRNMTIEEQVASTTEQPTVPKVVKEPGTHTKTTLFVRKVPFDATDAEFEAFFSTYGPLRSCFLVKQGSSSGETTTEDQEKGNLHKGFGFVHFADANDAAAALEAVSKIKFRDRKLKVEFALRKNVKQEGVPVKAQKGARKTALVKQVRPEITLKPKESPLLQVSFENCPKLPDRKQIYKRMRKAGAVLDMTLTEPNNILLSFSSSEEAHSAKEKLNGHIFKGFTMVVVQPENSIKAHRLIVRNLSFKATAADLETAFGQYGPLALEKVLIGQKNGKSAGFAFIQFLNKTDAEKAMESVTNTELCGRTVAVDWALPKKTYDSIVSGAQVDTTAEPTEEKAEAHEEEEIVESESENESNSDSEASIKDTENELEKTVFIRNLSFETDEADLSAALSRFGKVVSCKIVKNPTTGLGKGTAFVQFASLEAAKKALSAKPTDTSLPVVAKKSIPSTLVDPDAFIPDESTSAPLLHNRQLIILPAVDKKSANRLKEASTESFDRRHMNLIKESSLLKFQRAYPKKVIDEREKDIKDRLRTLKNDQNLFISDTRLSLRHLPVAVDEKGLKTFIRTCLADSAAPKTRISQVKIVRDATDKKRRSKGFGFVQLDDAKAALHLVRWLISDPTRWAKLGHRGTDTFPVIEFATEKQTVVNSRQKRLADSSLEKSQSKRVKPAENKKRNFESTTETVKSNKRARTAPAPKKNRK